jgi:tetratricopeptide (TPR) repeat protein
LAFTADEYSLDYAGCLADKSVLELRLGKLDEAFRSADEAIRVLEVTLRATADVALVYQVRGETARRRGDKARAATDLDRAVAICSTANADPAFLASARIARAQLTAETDRPGAIAALRESIAVLEPAPGLWKRDLIEAQALLTRLER